MFKLLNAVVLENMTGKNSVGHRARKEALSKGEQFYFTGIPCSKGHICKRYVHLHKCFECAKIQSKNAGKRYKGKQKEYDLKRYHKMSLIEFNNILNSQNNKCALCLNDLILKKLTHVDHCHDTGKIRGILCNKCNQGIGLLNHNPNLLRKAALYCEAV